MEPLGTATWPVQPRGCAVEPSGSERETKLENLELRGSQAPLRSR